MLRISLPDRQPAAERDAIAAEDALLFRVPKAAFEQLLDEPGFARFFLEGLASRLRLQSASSEAGSRSSLAKARDLGRRPLATIPPSATVEEAALCVDGASPRESCLDRIATGLIARPTRP